MIRTDNFIQILANKNLVDDVIFMENGYDIQYKGSIVSVRLDNKGGALIFNRKNQSLVEVQSGRLDEVLHRFIVQSLFGLQSKAGLKNETYKDVLFVPTKVIKNNVIFEDSVGRRFVFTDASPKAVLSYYNYARSVNADDAMLLLNNFKPYVSIIKESAEYVESSDVEVQLLKCSVNIDDYAVSPLSQCINDVGCNIVGNFLCSAADKINLMTFEEDLSKVFKYDTVSNKQVSSATIRTKNPFATQIKKSLMSNRNAIKNYANEKYPHGLSCTSMEQMLAYDSASIFNSLKKENPVDYNNLYMRCLSSATSVKFRLDSNKKLYSIVSSEGNSCAKFTAVPKVSEIRDSLLKEGYYISELESGLEFSVKDTAVSAILSGCTNFVPVSEKPENKVNYVTKLIGSACTEELSNYGINDASHAFKTITQIVIN